MSLHVKSAPDGTWVQCDRPYVKRNGVWVGVSEAWVKQAGVWNRAYEYDVIPPVAPEITLEVIEDFDYIKGVKTLTTRYIRVGVRQPGSANDTDVRLVRVLTTYNGKAPTTQFGGQYTSAQDKDWPGEPWSEWRYNDFGNHNDTSKVTYKQWPVNANAGTTVKGDQTYYFGGWTLDDAGNWSPATQAQIHIPKDSVAAANVVVKEARFTPNSSGSWRGDGFHGGDLIQQQTPRSMGLWFHGNQFTQNIGAQGTPTIKSAQIFVRREGAEDTGSANANIYLFWHTYSAVGSLPAPTAPGGVNTHEIRKLGTLAKGEGKWFAVPQTYYAEMNHDMKGMGLFWKDPDKASAFPADYSRIVSTAQQLRCGEVHVVWEEKL